MSDEIAQVRRHLNDIPDLLIEASHYLIPGTAPKDPDAHYAKGSKSRIPIAAEVFDLLNKSDKDLDDILLNRFGGERRLGVLPTLGLWVSLAYAELDDMDLNPRECCPAREHTVSGEAGWLNEYADAIVELHPDFPRDIEKLWTELRKVCRIRKEYVPTCPQCGHLIEGVYGDIEDEHAAWSRCTGCPKTWVHDAELRRLGATQPAMTLTQMATFLSRPLRDLYRLRDNNRFVAVGHNKRGAALYEVDHVRRASERLAAT